MKLHHETSTSKSIPVSDMEYNIFLRIWKIIDRSCLHVPIIFLCWYTKNSEELNIAMHHCLYAKLGKQLLRSVMNFRKVNTTIITTLTFSEV